MEPPSSRTRLVVADSNLRGFRGLTVDAFGSLLRGGPGQIPNELRKIVGEREENRNARSLEGLWRDTFRKYIRKVSRQRPSSDRAFRFSSRSPTIFRSSFGIWPGPPRKSEPNASTVRPRKPRRLLSATTNRVREDGGSIKPRETS